MGFIVSAFLVCLVPGGFRGDVAVTILCGLIGGVFGGRTGMRNEHSILKCTQCGSGAVIREKLGFVTGERTPYKCKMCGIMSGDR